jgi:uncharacterized protein YndB with AHSA1/START domain
VAHAFEVFTSRIDLWWPPGHRKFQDSRLVLEPVTGGRFVERAADGSEVTLGQVTRCEPPHHISYTWHPGAISRPTHVEVRFAADGPDTVVTVVHAEAGALGDTWPEKVTLFERGWQAVLAAFTAHAAAQENAE